MKPDLNKIIESFNSLNDQARYAILVAVVVVIILLDVFPGFDPIGGDL